MKEIVTLSGYPDSNSGRNPKAKDRFPTIHFQGLCCFMGCSRCSRLEES